AKRPLCGPSCTPAEADVRAASVPTRGASVSRDVGASRAGRAVYDGALAAEAVMPGGRRRPEATLGRSLVRDRRRRRPTTGDEDGWATHTVELRDGAPWTHGQSVTEVSDLDEFLVTA